MMQLQQDNHNPQRQEVNRRKFIAPDQTLGDAFKHVRTSKIQDKLLFENLYQELKNLAQGQLYIPIWLRNRCQQTFVSYQKQNSISPSSELDKFPTFQALLQDSISYRIKVLGKSHNCVQCSGLQFQDYSLNFHGYNLSLKILQTSLLKDLFDYVDQKIIYNLITNYTIVLKYNNDYVQVTGKPLSKDFSNAVNEKKRFHSNKVAQFIINPFQVNIRRTLIFYSQHMNSTCSMFHRNIFFDSQIKMSHSINQKDIVVQKFMATYIILFPKLKEQTCKKLYSLMGQTFQRIRQTFALRMYKNKPRVYFQCILKTYCSLSENYQSLKRETYSAIKRQQNSCEDLFDRLYKEASPYSSVTRLLRKLLMDIIPPQLLGMENLLILKGMLKQFVEMKRYENFKMQDYFHRLDVFNIPWLGLKYNPKFKKHIMKRGRIVLAALLNFIFNDVIIPLIKYHFYVTEQHKEANKIFYYRKPVWILISKLALYKFSKENLNPLKKAEVTKKKQSSQHYPEGKLRILPKKGTFRPIITFNKKIKLETGKNRQNLHRILANTQLVLRNMKNNLWKQLGFSVFDNRQIKSRFDDFVEKWRSKGSPKIAFFTLDIKKCYDSIDTTKLLQIIQKTQFIQQFYFIKRYERLYRNKRPLIGNGHMASYFNMKQRIAATPLSQDPLKIHQNDSIPALTVYTTKQKSINRQTVIQNLRQLCQGSIIQYKDNFWSQQQGIPQGLNVSGVLCSLYFGTLQNKYVKKHVKQGILMRLTDDYLYLGYEDQARTVLDSLLKCASQNQFQFADSKMSKNFEYHGYPSNADNKDYIVWIGKKINIKTLEMVPFFQKSDRLQYAMNVNLKTKTAPAFMKNKLKSLLTNHFESYFKPNLFPLQANLNTIRLYIEVSLEKFLPFLKKYFSLDIQNPALSLLEVLENTFHDYAIYICMLMKQCNDKTYAIIKRQLIQEITKFFRKHKSQSEFKFILKSYEKKLQAIKNK